MNTAPNKASLWKSCVEQGIFEKVPQESMYQVQGLFERTVNQFNNNGVDLATANQMVLKEFKFQLGKMIGLPIPQKTFEEINEEYKGQYQPKPPSQIEFSKEKDTPIQDLEAILQQKSEQRQNEMLDFFKEDSRPLVPLANMPQTIPVNNPQTTPVPTGELELHRRILESILTSQLKIIELLQRK
jgi:hypothetical protein